MFTMRDALLFIYCKSLRCCRFVVVARFFFLQFVERFVVPFRFIYTSRARALLKALRARALQLSSHKIEKKNRVEMLSTHISIYMHIRV